jgi:predicted ATPase/class 3 adenylate cyclase
MEPINSFGYWLRRRRKALDLTQDELAHQVGCALGTLKKIETDERHPSKQLAERLADCLEIPTTERAVFLKAARAQLAVDRLDVASPPDRPKDAPQPTPLPSGTVTFLFTDIEGSTKLWERHRLAMRDALARHEAILRQAIESRGGVVFKTIGDAVCAAFASAPQALAAALDAQRALQTEDWGAIEALRVRMALHTGTAEVQASDYAGFALSRVARILDAGHGGQVLLSLATQVLVRNHLPPDADLRDLGAHLLKDLARPERIFQLIAPGLPADFPTLHTLEARLTNLPAQPTVLIGRKQEVATLCELLRHAETRLVTLTGPGGTGKTRLALQATAELLDDFADGSYFVNLAPISDHVLVASTIAQTLGVKAIGGRPLIENLKTYLREKRLLLLLDNFEQVLEATSLVTELLAAAPDLKILVTSREMLHLRGEKEFAVEPLALPSMTDAPDSHVQAKTISQYAAVQLFIARAQDTRPDFVVTNANAPAVAEICYRLDGLPLVIELAATWVKLFPPEALLARLSSRLALLTSGARDLPTRQQTLRNTIAWSYDLLSQEERALFRRLGVFVGGWTLHAAEEVATLERSNVATLQRSNVLDLLAALVDKSLMRQIETADGSARFMMLETIREYALERLDESGEAAALRHRHAAYYLALSEQASPKLLGPEQAVWLNRLEREIDNLRAVFAWSLAAPDTADVGIRLAVALEPFWSIRGHENELRTWLGHVLAMSQDLTKQARAAALRMAADLESLSMGGDSAQARKLADEAVALYRELGDQADLAWALVFAGRIARNRGDYAHAAILEEEALRLYQEQNKPQETILTLLSLGDVALDQGDVTGAADRFQHARTLAQEQQNTWVIGWALICLGRTAYAQNDSIRAQALLEQGRALFRNLGEQSGAAMALFELGRTAHRQGDAMRAAALFAETLLPFQRTGCWRDLAYALAGLAEIAGERRQPERAARLLGAAEALREAIGHPLPPIMREEYDSAVAAARTQMDEDAFAAAWSAGRALSLEQAIAEALAGVASNEVQGNTAVD